jgi:hypothetical protein
MRRPETKGTMSQEHEPTDAILGIEALLAEARDQEGVDQLWSLALTSQILREHQAPREALERAERQLHEHIDGCRAGAPATVPPTLLDALADLAREAHG